MEKRYRKIWIGIFAILLVGALFLGIVLTVPAFSKKTQDRTAESEEQIGEEKPEKKVFLNRSQTDGKTQLALCIGDDIYPIEDNSWEYYDTIEILSDSTVINDKTVVFLSAYKRRVRRDLYIVEITEGSTQTYPFIQKGEIYSKAEQMAEMMGYRKPEPNPEDWFYAHDAVVRLEIKLWLEGDPDPYGQYDIDMEYIGNGIFHIGDYILEEAVPKG